MVGPGGPTGIIGRPRFPHQGFGNFQGSYPGQQFGFGQQQFGFDGQHNGLGPYNQIGPQYPGAFPGGAFNPQFSGGPYQGPQFDSTNKNSAVKKIEKSV